MRLVMFADLHLDTAFGWATPTAARRRRQALRETLVRIVQLADDVDADAILCGGDLYEHERFTPDTTAFVRSTFGGTHRPVFIAPGNHDWFGPSSLYVQATWPDNIHVFEEDHLVAVQLADGLTLWGAAHRAPANTDGFFDRGFRVSGSGVNLALFHGSERSGLVFEQEGKRPHAPFDARQIEQAGLHHAFVGHFHTPRLGEHHTYPGNPDPLSFGEDGTRGVVVADVSPDGSVERQWREVAVSQVVDHSVDVTGCASGHDIQERVRSELASLSGCVRLTLEGELSPDVELDLGDLAGTAPHLEVLVPRRGQLHVGYDLDVIAEETTVRGQFVRDVRAADLDEAERERILVTGLRALHGRADLEVV
jgi:DNA repair protein SbcD/Mre11